MPQFVSGAILKRDACAVGRPYLDGLDNGASMGAVDIIAYPAPVKNRAWWILQHELLTEDAQQAMIDWATERIPAAMFAKNIRLSEDCPLGQRCRRFVWIGYQKRCFTIEDAFAEMVRLCHNP